jgi:NAD-dependent deacetylase
MIDFDPQLINTLRAAQYIAVLTGAGVSAESGIPTFRDAQTGIWAQFNPQELATPEAFRRNPRLVWDWYAWRRQLVEGAEPNPAHYALAAIEARVPNFALITQNVDSLHTRAGSRNLIELHGNLSRVKCFNEDRVVEHWQERDEPPPRCPQCGGLLRPDVVWFGELLPRAALDAAAEAAQRCDVFLSIGTSGLVEPAASLPRVALQSGATVLLINPEVPTRATPPLYAIGAKAGEILPALVDATWP